MRSTRGFTLFELLIVMAMIGIISAIALPVLGGSTARNQVWTGSELIGSQIRQARLKAISRNMSFRVRFDCPAAGQFRVLQVTGNATIDNATTRCTDQQTYDSGVLVMPANVNYGTPPILTVNSRGVFSASGGTPGGIPTVITVSHTQAGTATRSLTMSATGQISFGAY